MYVDKPMGGHNLMQAIVRVNRVFGSKPGGLIVDYLGLADSLKRAMAKYTEGGGTGETSIDSTKPSVRRRYEICAALFHGFNWSGWTSGKATVQMNLIASGAEHILQQAARERLLDAALALTKAFISFARSIRLSMISAVVRARLPADLHVPQGDAVDKTRAERFQCCLLSREAASEKERWTRDACLLMYFSVREASFIEVAAQAHAL